MDVLQRVFDIAAPALIKQGQKSMIPNSATQCAYRGENSLRCAIGWAIADEHYRPGLEKMAADNSAVIGALAASLGVLFREVDRHSSALAELQRIHDDEDPKVWPEHLFTWARRSNLSTAALDAALAEKGA